MKRRKSTHQVGDYDISLELTIDDDSRLHDYGIRRSAWFRAIRIMNHYGSEKALELLDERALKAFARDDIAMCYRLRDLMVAIHAIEADEPQTIDRVH